MDVAATVHAVTAISATTRELVEIWRRMTGSGPTMMLSGRLIAVAWSAGRQERIHATRHASANDLADLSFALRYRPDCRYLLVQTPRSGRLKMIVLQRREEVAAGRVITPSRGSPLIVTCACGCALPSTRAQEAAR